MRIVKVKYNRPQQFRAIPGFVYCGRTYGGYEGSPLGNPFHVGKDGSLPEVLRLYRAWLEASLAQNEIIEAALAALTTNSVLGCWCLDKPVAGTGESQCHCDVIAEVWEKHFGQRV